MNKNLNNKLKATSKDQIKSQQIKTKQDDKKLWQREKKQKLKTKGEEKTIQYLTESFTAAGLQPGNPNGTWIQKATMLGVTSELRAQFLTDDERWVMKTGDDIIKIRQAGMLGQFAISVVPSKAAPREVFAQISLNNKGV